MKIYRNIRTPLPKIEEEYTKDMMWDSDEMYNLKEIIEELPEIDRSILILYVDEGSMAKAAKKLNVSPATIYNQIKRIREDIFSKL